MAIITFEEGSVKAPKKVNTERGLFTADLEAYNLKCASNKYERKWRIRPSEVGYCLRKTVMSILNICPAEEILPPTQRTFDNGQYVHKRYLEEYLPKLDNFRPANLHLFKDGKWVVEPFVEQKMINEDLWLRGAPDAILVNKQTGHLYVFELKSMRSTTFAKLYAPKPEHVVQVYIYMLMTDVKYSILFYEAKDTGETKEFLVERDPAVMETTVAKLRTIQSYVISYEATKQLPPTCSSRYCSACS